MILKTGNNFVSEAFLPCDSSTICSVENAILDFLVITDVDNEDDVYNAARELKITMNLGPDIIPSMVIRDCAALFNPILSHIIQLISYQQMSHFWKLS